MAARFDWQQAYAQLERARQALERGGEPPPEEVSRILRERARALARPLEEAPTPAEVVELLVFSLAGERYGVETAHVLEVIPLRGMTRVPCAPPSVLGVVNHRGQVLPALDLRRLLELPTGGVPEGSQVVAVEAGAMTLGLLAEAVEGIARVGTNEVEAPPAGFPPGRQRLIRGVTGELVAVLDLEALAQDPRVGVNDEVA